jgi:hypothetical protein
VISLPFAIRAMTSLPASVVDRAKLTGKLAGKVLTRAAR